MVRLLSAALLASACANTAHAVYRGVNLGGWLVLEPWLTSTVFAPTNTSSEWELCSVLGKQKCLETLQNHWSTFITRDDLVDIQQAGLNAVRIPLGYWAIVPLESYEPYVAGQYPYLIQAVQWAKELGLKVFLDIHGAPGSQNGWEETGIVGEVGFFDNTTNSDRTLAALKNLTSEFVKPVYGGVVTNIEPLNEPTLDYEKLRTWYTLAADVIGAANNSGINITISDGFFNPHSWTNYDPWDRAATKPAPHISVDTHQFWAFPPLNTLPKPAILNAICDFAKTNLRADPMLGIPPTLVGEWSLSTGITANSTVDASKDTAKRTWFRQLFEAQAAAYTPNAAGQPSIGWFFWTWKTDYNIDAWSYQKGIQQGYIPSNISDPSTYVFPILPETGCIDETFNWTAPPLPSSYYDSNSGPTGTSNHGSAAASSATSKGAAMRTVGSPVGALVANYGLAAWVGLATLSFASVVFI